MAELAKEGEFEPLPEFPTRNPTTTAATPSTATMPIVPSRLGRAARRSTVIDEVATPSAAVGSSDAEWVAAGLVATAAGTGDESDTAAAFSPGAGAEATVATAPAPRDASPASGFSGRGVSRVTCAPDAACGPGANASTACRISVTAEAGRAVGSFAIPAAITSSIVTGRSGR